MSEIEVKCQENLTAEAEIMASAAGIQLLSLISWGKWYLDGLIIPEEHNQQCCIAFYQHLEKKHEDYRNFFWLW